MLNGQRIVVVMPAYNAEQTLAQTVSEIDRSIIDHVILVDDNSTDGTVQRAQLLDLEVICHDRNLGYGGNQKTCYRAALAAGADVVVMVHPDYQYSPRIIVAIAAMVAYGEYDFVIGSRILGVGALRGGMPGYKYLFNRLLTAFENIVVHYKLSEYHTGLRAYHRSVLEALPVERNSDDFVFDNQMIVQAMQAGFRLGEVSCPTRYMPEASSISFRRSVTYGLGVVKTSIQYRLHRWGIWTSNFLNISRSGSSRETPRVLHGMSVHDVSERSAGDQEHAVSVR